MTRILGAALGWVSALALLTAPIPAFGLVVVGSLEIPGCAAKAIERVGTRVFLACSDSDVLHVIDVSNPRAPVAIGSTPVAPTRSQIEMAVWDDVAYLAVGETDVQRIDVSDPDAMFEIAPISSGEGTLDVRIVDGIAYVLADAYSDAAVRIYDVSDADAPVEIGSVPVPRFSSQVDLDEGRLYVIGSGLRIIDVSNPAHPVEVGSASLEGLHIAVHSGVAFLRQRDGTTALIDVSDATAPTPLTTLEHPLYASHIAFAGNLGFVAGAGLHVVDVAEAIEDPAGSLLVGSLGWDPISDVEIDGDLAYLAGEGEGLTVVDVSNPRFPRRVETVPLVGVGGPILFHGLDALGAWGSTGLRVLRFLGDAPALDLAVVDTPGWARSVAAADGFAFVADGYYASRPPRPASLRVMDVRDPRSATEIASLTFPGDVRRVGVSDGIAYVSMYDEPFIGVRLVDVTDPRAPRVVGDFQTPDSVRAMKVRGRLVYVADITHFRIFDASDLDDVIEIGSAPVQWGEEVAVEGDRAYVVSGHQGLSILDISDPTQPFQLNPPSGFTWDILNGIDVEGPLAWVLVKWQGVRLYDLSDPVAPRELADFRTLDRIPDAIAVRDGRAYVATGDGIEVIDFGPEYPPFPCSAAPHADLNGDHIVDVLDISMVASCLGAAPTDASCRVADVDCDDVVDSTDLDFVVARHGQMVCGLGYEVALVLPLIMRWRRNRLRTR